MTHLHLPHMPHFEWRDMFTNSNMAALRLFTLYTLPLSLVAPAMIYYAGITYGGDLLPTLKATQLQTISVVFFLAELAMTFLMALIIQRLGEVVDIKPTFEDAYTLATVAPTPLWLAPLALFIPSFIFNLTVGALAIAASGALIFYGVPRILNVEERGHATLLSGSILAAGLIAWAAMMYLTLFTWSMVTSTLSF